MPRISFNDKIVAIVQILGEDGAVDFIMKCKEAQAIKDRERITNSVLSD